MDIAKRTGADVQEEHGILRPDPSIRLQDFVGALNMMIPGLVGPTRVQVPPAGGWFVTDLRTVEADLIFAG
jgi:hypothetical protein